MRIEHQDFLHLYIGNYGYVGDQLCKLIGVEDGAIILHPITGRHVIPRRDFKLLLRPLSDMKEQEADDVMSFDKHDDFPNTLIDGAKAVSYLLKRGFDLFRKIEAGKAVDASTLNKQL